MLDVHPAPHAAHSWREFLIHIATIVIGLLIAIGLEQTVEHIHRRHQSEDLQAALHQEAVTNRRLIQYDYDSIDKVRRNIRLNMANLDRNGKAFVPVPPPHDTFLPFITTAWIAARGNGLIILLPDQVAASYWRVNSLADAMAAAIASLGDARQKVNSLLYLHASPSQLTAGERADLLRAYSEEDQEIGNLNYIVIGFDFMNEAALAGHVPSIADVAAASQRAQQHEGRPPQP
jgi:hypothetical protein